MKWKTWQDLHQDLQSCQWFTHVGETLAKDSHGLRLVPSWASAHDWATADISWWCVNEASNILRLHLSNNHRLEYRKWNDHIMAFAPERDELLKTNVVPLLPDSGVDSKVIEWIRSQLTRAYLECIYGPLANVHLVCDQIEWYLRGRFPCGWQVASEKLFPEEAVTIMF